MTVYRQSRPPENPKEDDVWMEISKEQEDYEAYLKEKESKVVADKT